jgi:hypothetical protein
MVDPPTHQLLEGGVAEIIFRGTVTYIGERHEIGFEWFIKANLMK